MKTKEHTLPNGKIALTVEDNLDSFDDGSPKFERMVAYGNGPNDWQWIHKDFKP